MNILNVSKKIILLLLFSLVGIAINDLSETEEEIIESQRGNRENRMSLEYLLLNNDTGHEKNDFFIYEDPSINKILTIEGSANENKKNKIICKFCGKKYKGNISYSRHLKRVHWRNFIDNANVKTVPTNFFVKDKISKKVDRQSHRCPRCTQTFRNDLRYGRHLLTCKK